MISIIITSKYRQDRESIVKALEEQNDFWISSIGEDGLHALKAAKTQHPDIIIMDYFMNDIDSFDLIHLIKSYSPSTGIIVLYSSNECNALDTVFQAGVSGCLQRQEGYKNIASSIKSVYYGGLYFGGLFKNYSLQCFSLQTVVKKNIFSSDLTNTELFILESISLGYSDREIAKNLNMTEGSLRNCVNKAKQKTRLNNRTQVCFYAVYADKINPLKIREQFLIE